jgi:hypothetical protein
LMHASILFLFSISLAHLSTCSFCRLLVAVVFVGRMRKCCHLSALSRASERALLPIICACICVRAPLPWLLLVVRGKRSWVGAGPEPFFSAFERGQERDRTDKEGGTGRREEQEPTPEHGSERERARRGGALCTGGTCRGKAASKLIQIVVAEHESRAPALPLLVAFALLVPFVALPAVPSSSRCIRCPFSPWARLLLQQQENNPVPLLGTLQLQPPIASLTHLIRTRPWVTTGT